MDRPGAARVSRRQGLLSEADEQRLVGLLHALGLPTDWPGELSVEQVALSIETDKKAAGGKIKFVCAEGIGRARFEQMSATEIATAALSGVRR